MGIVDRIEIARKLLYNAAKMNTGKEILLKISQKIDKYIVDFYHENEGQKGDMVEKENV